MAVGNIAPMRAPSKKGLVEQLSDLHGAPLPAALRSFFESDGHLAHEGKFAHGLADFSGDTKMKVKFGPSAQLKRAVTYSLEGGFADARVYVPFAALQSSDSSCFFLAVDPRVPTLPVLFFDYESGFRTHSPSFDAFLAGLLARGEKTPIQRLANACAKALKLHNAGKHKQVVALLGPLLAGAPASSKATLDELDDSWGNGFNLLGLAHRAFDRIDDAVAAFNAGVAHRSSSAALNLCDLQLNEFKNPELTFEQANKAKKTCSYWGDPYAWFWFRHYQGQAAILMGREADAVKVYHQVIEFCARDHVDFIQNARDDLQEHVRKGLAGVEIAERIVRWLRPPPWHAPSPPIAAENRAFWLAHLAPLPALREKLLAQMKEPGPDPSDTALAALFQRRELKLDACELTAIPNLTHFRALRKLSLDNNALRTLAGIEALPVLEKLRVDSNQLESLQGIAALTQLQELSVSNNTITSVEPLRGLEHLQSLAVDHNRIDDASPLASCRQLSNIVLHDNPLGLGGIDALAELVWLEHLDLDGVPEQQVEAFRKKRPDVRTSFGEKRTTSEDVLSSVSAWWKASHQLSKSWSQALAGMLGHHEGGGDPSQVAVKQLMKVAEQRVVDLVDAALDSIVPLQGFRYAECVCLQRNAIEDLTPLSNNQRLRDLSLQENRIVDISPLATLVNLTSLNCSDNPITSLDALRSCVHLTSLDCANAKLESIDAVRNLAQLTHLEVVGNNIASLEPLRGHASITKLYVSFNRLSDLSPLADCRALEIVHCAGNPGMRGATSLARLPRLREVISRGALPDDEVEALTKLRPDVWVD